MNHILNLSPNGSMESGPYDGPEVSAMTNPEIIRSGELEKGIIIQKLIMTQGN